LLGAGSAEYRYLVWTILCAVMAVVTSLLPVDVPLPSSEPDSQVLAHAVAD
jgi:hypothetical protein